MDIDDQQLLALWACIANPLDRAALLQLITDIAMVNVGEGAEVGIERLIAELARRQQQQGE